MSFLGLSNDVEPHSLFSMLCSHSQVKLSLHAHIFRAWNKGETCFFYYLILFWVSSYLRVHRHVLSYQMWAFKHCLFQRLRWSKKKTRTITILFHHFCHLLVETVKHENMGIQLPLKLLYHLRTNYFFYLWHFRIWILASNQFIHHCDKSLPLKSLAQIITWLYHKSATIHFIIRHNRRKITI